MRKQPNTQMELNGKLTILDANQLKNLKGGSNREASLRACKLDIIVVDDSMI